MQTKSQNKGKKINQKQRTLSYRLPEISPCNFFIENWILIEMLNNVNILFIWELFGALIHF